MFDRPSGGEKAVLVHFAHNEQELQLEVIEFQQLVASAGGIAVSLIMGILRRPTAKYYMGQGKAYELRDNVVQHQADLIIVNNSLSPAQQRNLEQLCQCRVLDRTGLILDIFAQRARSFEGKLQVELAQLQHYATRLVRGWTHLERQKGGIGLRGPGETQLESDRRLLRERIKHIRKKLTKVTEQRAQARRARRRAQVPTVSLVGYTNAGKSCLFNALSEASGYVANQLFATLDPTIRKLKLQDIGQQSDRGGKSCTNPVGDIVVADTVGFIRQLPPELIRAFHATLEETCDADLLLHVIDAADPQRDLHTAQVRQILKQIKADGIPCLEIYNKIDLTAMQTARVDRDQDGQIIRLWISAAQGVGIELLKQAIIEKLTVDVVYQTLVLRPAQGRLRAKLYEVAGVIDERVDDEGNFVMSVRLMRYDYQRLLVGEYNNELE